MTRRTSWLVIAILAVVSLGWAAFDDGPPRSTEDQVEAIARTLKCPTCGGQSVGDSDSAASRAIRLEIARQVEDGRSADEVRASIASRFGDQVQLVPSTTGFAGLVWILPVVVLVLAVAGVTAAFVRWRRLPRATPTDEDRALVDRARQP